jgi:U3 small nucleolar ribonucleoprotein protein LCP5
MLGLRLTSLLEDDSDDEEVDGADFTRSFAGLQTPRPALDTVRKAEKAIEEELRIIREVMEKTKSLESKVSYQVKKLVTLAASTENAKAESSGKDVDDEEDDDPLSYKPNVNALLSSKAAGKAPARDDETNDRAERRRIKNSRRSITPSDEEEETAKDGIYRAPRLGAIPYNEGKQGK